MVLEQPLFQWAATSHTTDPIVCGPVSNRQQTICEIKQQSIAQFIWLRKLELQVEVMPG